MWWGGISVMIMDLPAREARSFILRTRLQLEVRYEWRSMFPDLARIAVSPMQRIERIRRGRMLQGGRRWNARLLQATDDLTGTGHVAEPTWAALAELTEKQRMDWSSTVGNIVRFDAAGTALACSSTMIETGPRSLIA